MDELHAQRVEGLVAMHTRISAPAMKCGAVYPGEPHGQLTCLKPWGHDDDHTVCLGAHDHGEGDLEYEWVTWEQGESLVDVGGSE